MSINNESGNKDKGLNMIDVIQVDIMYYKPVTRLNLKLQVNCAKY